MADAPMTEIERIARRLCELGGNDPDMAVIPPGVNGEPTHYKVQTPDGIAHSAGEWVPLWHLYTRFGSYAIEIMKDTP